MSSRRGVLAFVLLLALLGGGVLVAAVRLRSPAASSGARVLVFDVPADLDEGDLPIQPFSLLSSRYRGDRLTVYDVVNALRQAAGDEHIEALVLHLDHVDWGWGKLAEVRDALVRFRRSGKPLYATLSGGGEREYLLATAAGTVALPPSADLMLDGLSVSAMYFKGTFDKLGVVPNFAHVGQFKSAVESYTREDMSPPARAALGALLDDLYGYLVDSLASARGMTSDSVRSILDDGPFTAADARARGLVDTLLYAPDLDSLVLRRAGHRASTQSFSRYIDRIDTPRVGPRVALLSAEGTIVSGKSMDAPGEGRLLGAETLIEALRQVRERKAVRAVVLRIDSPGGSAQASDEIWHEVERCRRVKPVIVSMSDYAASGGYYIAVASDSIIAEPTTLTGSIGVFGGKLNILGLYRKLGLNVETVSRGRHAEMLSPYRDFTPEEAERYTHQLEATYRDFLARVAHGRHRSTASVDSVGQGRVWSGKAARELGLVDRFGGIEAALEAARSRAHISAGEDLVVERYPRVQRSFFERMLEQALDDQTVARAPIEALSPVLRAWLAAAHFPAGEGLALMPYSVEIR